MRGPAATAPDGMYNAQLDGGRRCASVSCKARE